MDHVHVGPDASTSVVMELRNLRFCYSDLLSLSHRVREVLTLCRANVYLPLQIEVRVNALAH